MIASVTLIKVLSLYSLRERKHKYFPHLHLGHFLFTLKKWFHLQCYNLSLSTIRFVKPIYLLVWLYCLKLECHLFKFNFLYFLFLQYMIHKICGDFAFFCFFHLLSTKLSPTYKKYLQSEAYNIGRAAITVWMFYALIKKTTTHTDTKATTFGFYGFKNGNLLIKQINN